MRANRYLRYFYVVGERGEKPPGQVDNTVHIGGSVEAALVKKLKVIDREELLDTLAKAGTIDELHNYLKEQNRAHDFAPEPLFPSPTLTLPLQGRGFGDGRGMGKLFKRSPLH